MNTIQKKAYAKINLGLDVLKRLPNGYHEVKMVMQTVDLYDVLTFTKREDQKILIQTNQEELPCDEHNLIYVAIKKINEYAGTEHGVTVYLEKNIPIAAGMAGGSSDAAATLKAMNELFDYQIGEEELRKIGVTIGADVPYCIMGGTALSEGIGEVLTKISSPPTCELLIAKPDLNVSTKYVYENLHLEQLEHHPDIDGMVEAISEKNLEGVCDRMENVLETVTAKKYPVIDEIKKSMLENGAKKVLMSGSGPTVFGIFEMPEVAKKAQITLQERGLAKQIFVTRFFNE